MKRMSVTIAAVAIHQLSFKEIFIETNEIGAPDKALVSTVSAMTRLKMNFVWVRRVRCLAR